MSVHLTPQMPMQARSQDFFFGTGGEGDWIPKNWNA